MEVPAKYLPAMVAGLAYRLAMKNGEAGGRLPSLKIDYDEQLAYIRGIETSIADDMTPPMPVQPMQPAPPIRDRKNRVTVSGSGRGR